MQKEIIMKIVLCAFFIVLFSLFSYAQEKIETYSEVLEDGKVNIYYDLKGDPSEEYEIKLNLRRTSNPEFKYSPDDLEGDYGTGKYATGKKRITWKLNDKEKTFADGEDFYFEVIAQKASKGLSWYYYLGGAVLGGVAAILLGGSKSGGGNSGGSSTALPNPPGRP
jgi:hypothetical protein